MKKSYFDKKRNKYIDTTTGQEYTPKGLCEICKSPYFLTVHHFLNQQKCLNDLNAKKVKQTAINIAPINNPPPIIS